MRGRPPRSTRVRSSAASDVYKRQGSTPGHVVLVPHRCSTTESGGGEWDFGQVIERGGRLSAAYGTPTPIDQVTPAPPPGNGWLRRLPSSAATDQVRPEWP